MRTKIILLCFAAMLMFTGTAFAIEPDPFLGGQIKFGGDRVESFAKLRKKFTPVGGDNVFVHLESKHFNRNSRLSYRYMNNDQLDSVLLFIFPNSRYDAHNLFIEITRQLDTEYGKGENSSDGQLRTYSPGGMKITLGQRYDQDESVIIMFSPK
ncbi:MAG: hypothetical protein LBV80_07820 [Deltaproteobacteria bacterium]|jgi:hypothetical protein|nr:hypothetical protein [Deltaproteobacteria bacterium]